MRAVRQVATSLTIAGLAAIAQLASAKLASAAEPQLVVRVASGREFRGVLDAASSSEQLLLRTEMTGIVLRRPIRWERVVGVTEDGEAVDVAALRARVQESGVGSRESGAGSQRTLLRKIELREEIAPQAAPAVEELPTVPQSKVSQVAFDASIANWDADVETDGVLLDVAPVDINRRIVPVNATLEVELFAPQRRTLDLAPQSGGDTIELVERWTRAITPEDFGPSGVRLRLPFGAITPELQPNWTAWHYGLVHVKLSVPGHGVFEDSRDGVRIRPWAPNRDRLEMKTGQRFLGTENLGRRD